MEETGSRTQAFRVSDTYHQEDGLDLEWAIEEKRKEKEFCFF